MNILIADDHKLVRKGLSLLIKHSYPQVNIEEACDGNELLSLSVKIRWDVIVSDISMPGLSGVEVIKDVKQLAPETPVLVLSAHSPAQYALRAIRSGAACYLCKDCRPEEFTEAIGTLSEGKRYLTAEVAALLAEFIGSGNRKGIERKLTDREFEIFRLIGAGKEIGEIAKSFGTSKSYIYNVKDKILEKMGFQKTGDIIRYVTEMKNEDN